MKAVARRAGVITVLGLLVLVPGLHALGECASQISSGEDDEPLTGRLVGERTVSYSSGYTFNGSFGNPTITGSFTYQRTSTTSYNVGVYEMSDGTSKEVRCDTYSFA